MSKSTKPKENLGETMDIKVGRISFVPPGVDYKVIYRCSVCGETSKQVGYDLATLCGRIEAGGCPKCQNPGGGKLEIVFIGPDKENQQLRMFGWRSKFTE